MSNIVFLGLVSFFSDISSEMVYPLIPLYLTAAFGATPALVGVIEGIAESVASLLKVFSGYVTDKKGKRKTAAFFGYAAGLVYKVALLAAGSWGGILAARVTDRIGKGIRTAPRDSLVSDSAGSSGLGRAFGIHKALDMAGSAIGILLSFILLASSGGSFNYKRIFVISAIPAVLGVAMLLFVKENKSIPAKVREPFWKKVRGLDSRLKLYLVTAFIFTLGNSSNTFLLLRAKSIGFTDTNVVLLYFVYNITAAALSVPLGKVGQNRKKAAAHRRLSDFCRGLSDVRLRSQRRVAVFHLCALRNLYRRDSRCRTRLHCRNFTAGAEGHNARTARDCSRSGAASGKRRCRFALESHCTRRTVCVRRGSVSACRSDADFGFFPRTKKG